MTRGNIIIYILLVLTIYGCKDSNTKDGKINCEYKMQIKQKQEIVKFTDYVMNNTPLIYNRPNGVAVDTMFKLEVQCLLNSICQDVVQSSEFCEFSIIFLLNMYINDLQCCNQSYDLLEQMDGSFSIIINQQLIENNIERANEEIFTSDEVLRLNKTIDKSNNEKITFLLNRINRLSNPVDR